MSVEDRARVVADIKAGRFELSSELGNPAFLRQLFEAALGRTDFKLTPPVLFHRPGMPSGRNVDIPLEYFYDLDSKYVASYGSLVPPKPGSSWHETTPVVDVTPLVTNATPPAGDSLVFRPPWKRSFIVMERSDGYMYVLLTESREAPDYHRGVVAQERFEHWDDVRWSTMTWVWLARPGERPFGPVTLWTAYIDADGELLLTARDDLEPELADMATEHTLSLYAFVTTFLNCRNITIRETHHPRPVAKRLRRIGVTLSELVITSVGETVRSTGPGVPAGAMPLTSVRGHMAEYGPEYGKGLLFGKYAGRFWIPAHARGSREHGVTMQEFTLEDTP